MITTYEEIENCKYTGEIQKAVEFQNKYRFFAIPFDVEKDNLRSCRIPYANEYLQNTKNRLNNDEALDFYVSNLTYPLFTTSVSEKIKAEYLKIFDAENRIMNIDDEIKIPDRSFFDTKYNINFFQNTFFNQFHESPNNLYAVVPDGDSYSVEFYPISALRYIDDPINPTEVLFEVGTFELNGKEEKLLLNIDIDGYYNIIEVGNDFISAEHIDGLTFFKHNKGVCPVGFVSNINFSETNKITKANYLNKRTGRLNRLLYVSNVRDMMDTYSYAHQVKYKKSNCEYEDGSMYCNDGMMYYRADDGNVHAVIDGNSHKKCPSCNNKSYQAGTSIGVDLIPDNPIALNSVMAYINPPVDFLNNRDEYVDKFEAKIFKDATNRNDDINNNLQNNAQNVQNSVNSRENALIYYSKPIEDAIRNIYTWYIQIATNEANPSVDISLGTDFYLNSDIEYLELERQSQELGIASITDYKKNIIYSKYANNYILKSEKIAIYELMNAFKPYQNATFADIKGLLDNGNIDFKTFDLATNFDTIVHDFENSLPTSLGKYYDNLRKADRAIKLLDDFESFLEKKYKSKSKVNNNGSTGKQNNENSN